MKPATIIIAVALLPAVLQASADNKGTRVPQAKDVSTIVSDNDAIFDYTIDRNVTHPKVGSGQRQQIVEFQRKQAKELIEKGFVVESTRNDEVLVVTIEAERLFMPNDTLLRVSSQPLLRQFTHFLDKQLWKMLLVMYADNTGSNNYLKELSVKRVDAVYDWFDAKCNHTEQLVPYGLGNYNPLLPNNSIDNRRKNRRLEIFLIPNENMIKLAKDNKLK